MSYLDDFPKSRAEYFAACPPSITHYQWLFHDGNRFRFERWVKTLIKDIDDLSQLTGWTLIRQVKLPARYDIDVRWLREILNRLVIIEVLETRRTRKREYRIASTFLVTSTSDHTADQKADRTSDQTSDPKSKKSVRSQSAQKTSKTPLAPEHDLRSSLLSRDSEDSNKRHAGARSSHIQPEPKIEEPISEPSQPAAIQSAANSPQLPRDEHHGAQVKPIDAKPADESSHGKPSPIKEHGASVTDRNSDNPARGSRFPFAVILDFMKAESAANPKILDTSRLAGARYRDGRDDEIIALWLAGSYKPMDADRRRAIHLAKTNPDLFAGGKPETPPELAGMPRLEQMPDKNCDRCHGLGMRYAGQAFWSELVNCECARIINKGIDSMMRLSMDDL